LLSVSDEAVVFLMMGLTMLAVFFSLMVFPTFQAFVEQRYLGIKLPYQNLQETYSSRIAASASMSSLLLLLHDEVFPSLLVRQFAFTHVHNGNLKILLTQNVSANELPDENKINELVVRSGKYTPHLSSKDEWIRLILPLRVGDSLIGFWLLGRRDPDDLYSLAEIPILQSLANQTAIGLSNILHAEQLRKMYQLDIERYEQERLSLALDLHDSILNQLAVLRNNLEETNLSQKFQIAYEELTRRLREIVSDLRPPMLMYGFKPAIEELVDNLMERIGDKVKIKVDIQLNEERYPQTIEQHLYRIVQEACENALRHSHATQITINAKLMQDCVSLLIEDNGIGFPIEGRIELDDLLVGNHFGLVGMMERAMLIGAQVDIHSIPGNGTQIQVIWDIDN
jgi:signal transduction histidine kinase